MRILVALILTLLSTSGRCAELVGLDILALARVDARMVAEEIPQGYAIGVLEGTFGSVIPPLNTVLQTGKVRAFRAHLVNWTCRRNNNCEAGEPRPEEYSRVLERRAKAFAKLAKTYPGVRCYLSPLLEYDEQDPQKVRSWVDIVKRAAPGCSVVLSPFKGVTVPGTILERHGNNARAAITSNDGQNLLDADTSRYPSQATLISFGWVPRFNCRTTGEKTFTPPLKRSLAACLTRDDVRQVVRVMKPETPKPSRHPTTCKEVREPAGGELWKTNAEDYASGDPRGNKPLFISRSTTPVIDVLSPDGKRISCLKYYGPYEKGFHRHYSGWCENRDSSVSLMDKARGEWIYLKDGNRCILVNAIRRKGYYR